MAKDTTTSEVDFLQTSAVRLSRVFFFFLAAYALYNVTTDAWDLVTRELTSQRWIMFGVMLAATTSVWFLARIAGKGVAYYRSLIIVLVLAGISLASFAVYTEQGMASLGVMLYAIPIVASAGLLSKSALLATAALSTAAYVVAATRYFYVFFNEGFKVQLYTTLMLYSAVFFVLAALLWVALTPGTKQNK